MLLANSFILTHSLHSFTRIYIIAKYVQFDFVKSTNIFAPIRI